jgi:hypothetical protein
LDPIGNTDAIYSVFQEGGKSTVNSQVPKMEPLFDFDDDSTVPLFIFYFLFFIFYFVSAHCSPSLLLNRGMADSENFGQCGTVRDSHGRRQLEKGIPSLKLRILTKCLRTLTE